MKADFVPAGYATLAEAGAPFGLSANGLRQMLRRGQVRAVVIRNRIYVDTASVREVYQPKPYAAPAAA